MFAAPPSRQELPTTSGAIAIGNLSSQLRGFEGVLASHPHDLGSRSSVVTLLETRFQFSGNLADLERVVELGEQAVEGDPENAKAYLLRASTRSAVHRFREALEDLEQAKKHKASASDIAPARASIVHALGRYDEAYEIKARLAKEQPNVTTLSNLGVLLTDMGRYQEAREKFSEALRKYRDVSPFPVAQVMFQWGVLLEKSGDAPKAAEWFRAAAERLPTFAHALTHLAQLESPAKGVELLAAVAESSDDPEITAELGLLHDALGHADKSKELGERARARYEELGKKYPEAFADHIARFYLAFEDESGKSPRMGGQEPRASQDARRVPVGDRRRSGSQEKRSRLRSSWRGGEARSCERTTSPGSCSGVRRLRSEGPRRSGSGFRPEAGGHSLIISMPCSSTNSSTRSESGATT